MATQKKKKPAVVSPPAPTPSALISTLKNKGITFLRVFAVAVLLTAGVLWVTSFWAKPSDRLSSSKQNGIILGVYQADEEKVQVETYDIGRKDGLSGRGIRMVSLEELQKIADDVIGKYRSGGDTNYRNKQEGQDGARQQQPPPSPRKIDKPAIKRPAPSDVGDLEQ